MNSANHLGILRILDAEANRAAEAARVVEDYLRFVLDDRHLTELCKRLRHQLASTVRECPGQQCLEARETQGDVGTTLSSPEEHRRADAEQVLAANAKRLEQSLRSLEEYAKVLSPSVAARFEALRYEAYTLERAAVVTASSCLQLPNPALYVLLDGGPSTEAFEGLAAPLVRSGVDVLQLRDKKLDDRTLVQRARLLRRLTRNSQTLFIMNDRPDLAVLAQADGVHVGQDELSVKDVRSIVGPGRLVGVSTHCLEQARRAVLDGANYLGVGPTFESKTKAFDELPGLNLLRAVSAEIRLPAFAIGGIAEDNLHRVMESGFRRVAVGAALTHAADPAETARRLLSLLKDRGASSRAMST